MDIRKMLICVEGFDRTGKDTLLGRARVDWCKEAIVYDQPRSEDTGADYRNPKAFSAYLTKHFKQVVADLNDLLKKPRCVIMTRFLVSDNSYSQILGREKLLEKAIEEGKLFDSGAEIKIFLLKWKNYSEYLKRVRSSNSVVEYSEEEFSKIQDLMVEETNKLSGHIMEITADTPKDDIFLELGNYVGKKVVIKKSRKWSV